MVTNNSIGSHSCAKIIRGLAKASDTRIISILLRVVPTPHLLARLLVGSHKSLTAPKLSSWTHPIIIQEPHAFSLYHTINLNLSVAGPGQGPGTFGESFD